LRDDPVVRQRIAQLVTEAEVARVLGLKVVAASMKGEKVPGTPPPTVESSEYKLFATSSRGVSRMRRWTSAVRARSCGCRTKTAPMEGRAESTYRYTVIDTDRRRRVGDPEEHHRPARARASEELLEAVLKGVTVLDLASVGPAARTSRAGWPTTARAS